VKSHRQKNKRKEKGRGKEKRPWQRGGGLDQKENKKHRKQWGGEASRDGLRTASETRDKQGVAVLEGRVSVTEKREERLKIPSLPLKGGNSRARRNEGSQARNAVRERVKGEPLRGGRTIIRGGVPHCWGKTSSRRKKAKRNRSRMRECPDLKSCSCSGGVRKTAKKEGGTNWCAPAGRGKSFSGGGGEKFSAGEKEGSKRKEGTFLFAAGRGEERPLQKEIVKKEDFKRGGSTRRGRRAGGA